MLKIAKVIHIFKKTEKFIPDNFRPTSLLNILNKIMETIMYKRLIIFLEKAWFGFWQNYSTSTALIKIIDDIYDDLEKGKYIAAIFDTVNHNILIDKLNFYGIRGQTLNWFESYLKGEETIYTSK